MGGQKLQKSEQKPEKVRPFPTTQSHRTGEPAPVSGVYFVEHGQHIARREVYIHQGTDFPACPRCGEALEFRLVEQVAPISEDPDFS